MKPNINKMLKKFFVNTKRRCEFPQYGTHLLIDGEWVRFYMVFKEGIIVLREREGTEYPEFIEYNKLDENILFLLCNYFMRRIFKERFLM